MESTREFRADRIGQEASDWVRRLASPSPETNEQFADWIIRSPDHIHHFLLATALLEEWSQALGYGALGGIAATVEAVQPDAPAPDNARHPVPPVSYEPEDDLRLMADAARQLPERCRRALTLSKVYGCSQQEIAARLALTEQAVEQELVQALCHLMWVLPEQRHPG